MNKARRNELKQLKYKRRLKIIGQCNAETLANPKGERYNFTGFKTSGKPCSCYACQQIEDSYNRAKIKRQVQLC